MLHREDSEINIYEVRKLLSFYVVTELDRLPTFHELEEAIKQMLNEKSSGSDTILAEGFKRLDDRS